MNIEVGYRYEHPTWGWAEIVKVVDNWEIHVRFDKTGFVWVSKHDRLATKHTKDLVQLAEILRNKTNRKPSINRKLEGSVHTTKKWGDIEILEYMGDTKFLVRFVNTGNTRIVYKESFSTCIDELERDRIKAELVKSREQVSKPTMFDKVQKDWVQACGGTLTIVDMEEATLLVKVSLKGVIVDKWIPFVHVKAGALDLDSLELLSEFKNKTGRLRWGRKDCDTISETAHRKWSRLRSSCYLANNILLQPCYLNATVCDEWRLFSNFQTWFLENYKDGAHLDKDLLSSVNNKQYSPDTCMFVSQKLNSELVVSKLEHNPSGIIGARLTENNTYAVKIKDEYGKSVQYGTFDCKYEAHKHWQLAKAAVMERSLRLGKYAEYETTIVEDIITNLRKDAENGVVTEKLYV